MIKTQIHQLNSQFYARFAQDFSATRQRIQPGVNTVLEGVSRTASILDLGCGNGSVVRSLAGRGHKGSYLGIDFSEELITIARSTQTHPEAHFIAADLCNPEWSVEVQAGFEQVFCFAALHHIPGMEERLRVVQQAASLMADQAGMTVSVWNFLASPRLKKRILPWSVINIADEDVDPGDYLLDWRRGGSGIRYVHHFTEEELGKLAEAAGLQVVGTFYSDGENGRLGMYQRWINTR
ncbi:MAG: methyltransferase domain-containing protein [Anaerolineales bacterium]|nr:methyltransferase domain-containing protein [Anaerolineales bacterium]